MRIPEMTLRMTLLAVVVAALLSCGVAIANTRPAHAAPDGWNAEEIIDDIVFTNKNTMSTAQIQDFLNSKVSVCDTDGTQPSEFGGGTRAQYAANASLHPKTGAFYPPFTCLKSYTEGGLTSAQIIYNAAQQYQINPQVLIVLLQKEQSLVTDTWPSTLQYQRATGYGCPDHTGGTCDAQYYGFTNQVKWAATMFRSIMDDSPTWNKKYYPYWQTDPNTGTTGSRYVYYNPTASCGGSWLNIQNRATQALYNYTPYQPNQDALNAAMGQTVNCGAYGNMNFYQYFTSWFGSTTNSHLNFSVIQVSGSSALYLQTSAGKYYIPSGSLMKDWGIDTLPIQQVSQTYLNSLTAGPNLTRLLKDDWNNYFVVDSGKIHYVRDQSYLSLWNVQPSDAVQSLGLAYVLQSGSWLGRFVQDSSQPTGPLWLIDKGKKHLISDTSMLYQWRYTPDQLTTISTALLDSIPTDQNNVTALASTGSASYVVDAGTKLSLNDTNIKNAYYGSLTPIVYDPITLSFLPNGGVAGQFAINTTTGQWFMLEGGKKHYISSAKIAELWGKTSSTQLTPLTGGYFSGLPNAGNLSAIVQTTNPSMYWVVDGTKHYIADSNTANAWIKPGDTPPTYSTESLNTLTRSADATTTINAANSPYFYIMDAGVKRYLTTTNARSGLGGAVMTTSSSLVDNIPEGSFLTYIVKNASGQGYLLMNNVSYSIDPIYNASWGVAGAQVVADSTIARYPSSGISLKSFIRIGDTSYVMVNGNKVPITKNYDAYQPNTLGQVTLPKDYFNTTPEATYLVKSTDIQNSNVWLMSGGKKHLFTSFSAYVSYGYLSRGLPITSLTPEALDLIPTATETPGLFIRTEGSWGIKFISFGTSLGFPDGDTLFSLLGSAPVLIVSDSVYNNFPLAGSISKILKDDAGKIYLVENGAKRWITNGKAYDTYRSYPVTYLYGTTLSLIPDGPAIN